MRRITFQKILLLLIIATPFAHLEAQEVFQITSNPQSVLKPEGGSATFSVSVAHGTGSYSYQWRRNGLNISGATGSSYTRSNLSLADHGSTYSVRVRNDGNTKYSSNATLSVRAKPTVSISSSNTTLLTGDSISFNSSASAAGGGSITSYQWKRGSTVVGSSSSYSISSVTGSNAGSYTLKVTDSIGGTQTSNVIVVKIAGKDPVSIKQTTVSDSDQGNYETVDVLLGESANYTVRAKGNAPLTFRWYNKSRQSAPIHTETIRHSDDAEHPYATITGTSSVSFKPTRYEDLSKVYVTVSGYGSSGSTKAKESVINVHYAPDIYEKPKEATMPDGSFAIYRCFLGYEEDDPLSSDGSKKTGRIKWYRNGVEVTNGAKHTISDNGDFSLLIVNNLSQSDRNAKYVCRSVDLDWDHVYKNSPAVNLNVTTFGSDNVPTCSNNQVLRDTVCIPNGVPNAPTKSLDTDGDGLSDSLEKIYGSSISDAGSISPILQNPGYTLWNGFLGMVNILELVNPGNSKTTLTVSLYTISGELGNKVKLTLAPGSQQDLILNDMPGFSADSYGLITVSFDKQLDGRLFFYRPSPASPTNYSFAFGTTLTNPTYGRAVVGFNTFQPSANLGEARNSVTNWLSIVNLSKNTKSFQVSTFAIDGTLLKTNKITIAGNGRTDLDGGHVVPGPNNVGLQEIIPFDNSSPYIAQLVRYGANNPPEITATDYDFAFPLAARPGNGEILHLPISSRFGSLNWLEVVNTLDFDVSVNIELRNAAGELKNSRVVELAPFSQVHILASEFLAPEEIGSATLTPDSQGAVIAQSMYYFRNPAGSITSMYGTQHKEALSSNITGSYNLFLGMQSYTRITNPKNKSISLTASVNDQSGALSAHELNIPAYGSIELPLHNLATYQTSLDTYGSISIDAGSNKVLAESIRVRTDSNGLEFVAPTTVR